MAREVKGARRAGSQKPRELNFEKEGMESSVKCHGKVRQDMEGAVPIVFGN